MNNKEMIVVSSCRMLNEANKTYALSNGVRIVDHAFLEFEYLSNPELIKSISSSDSTLIFTSKQAVIAYVKMNLSDMAERKCYCIEGETARYAEELGFTVISTANDAAALAEKIIADAPGSLLFLTGDRRRDEMPDKIGQAQIEMKELVVYTKKLQAVAIEEAYDALAFFSPSQVDAFLLKNTIKSSATLFCIGETTAAYLKSKGYGNCILASSSSEKSMVDKICEYYK